MKYVTLKDVCTINMGQSPDSDSYNDNGEGVPFFQGNADFGERYPVTRKWCSAPTKMAAPEDILISVRAPIGAMNYAKEECCIGRGLAALTPDKTKVSPKFIFWLLKGKNAELNSKGTGSTFKAIGRKVLEETKVPDIPLEKQLEHSETLEKIYAVIQHRKSELQMLDDLIKARFVEMFGDPVHSDKYGTRKLSSCVAEKTDMVDGPFGSQVNTKIDYIEKGEIPVIRTVNVKKMSFSPVDLKYMTRKKYETVIRSQVLPGDVILTKVGTIGNVCVFPDTYKEAVLSTTGSCRIRVDNSIVNTEFFAYNLLYLKSKLLEIASAGVQPFLNMNHVKNIDILNVPLGKQTKFADFVHQVDKSKVAVQKALDETQMLFDSLMQKYFG